MPAVSVWLVDVAFCGVMLLVGAARVADRVSSRQVPPVGGDRKGSYMGPVAVGAFAILIVLKLMLWISVPEGVSTWPGVWGSMLNFAYPRAFYRPLILAPLWGRWGVMLASGIGRPANDADGVVRSLTRRQSSRVILGWFLLIAALTAVYCGYNAKWVVGCVIALGVLGTTYLYSVAVTHWLGGQTRDTLLAGGLVGELSFLLLYFGLSVRIYAS
jgi:cobalamin synthase